MEVEPLPNPKEWELEAVLKEGVVPAGLRPVSLSDPVETSSAVITKRPRASSCAIRTLPETLNPPEFTREILVRSAPINSSSSDTTGKDSPGVNASESDSESAEFELEIESESLHEIGHNLDVRGSPTLFVRDFSNGLSSHELAMMKKRALTEAKKSSHLYQKVAMWYSRMSMCAYWTVVFLSLLGTLVSIISPGGTTKEVFVPIITALMGVVATVARHFQLEIKTKSYTTAWRDLVNLYDNLIQDFYSCPASEIYDLCKKSRMGVNEIQGRNEPIPGWAVQLSLSSLNPDML